jgi:hypothetical protein
MLKDVRKWLGRNRTDVMVWSFCICLIVWALHPVLSSQIISGWDLTGHFYLQTKMVDFLKTGAITGYDANWFGGYPAFTFYGPLPYILIALLHLLSFGVIPITFLFNCFLFLLPFFFLSSVYYTSRVWFGEKIGPLALIFSLFFLFASREYAHFGVGLNSEICLGLFASLFAISLMVFLLGIFGRQRLQRERKDWKLILVGGVLLAMIILTHALTTIFTGVLMAVLVLSYRKNLWRPVILTFLLGLLLSSFWLVPFLLNLKFTSAQMIGMLPLSKDPLFILYPKFNEFFVPGVVLLICSVVGVAKLFKSKDHFWPYAFVLTLIILPRDYLVHVINLPLHYYRFVPHIFILNIFLAAVGFGYILKSYPRLISKVCAWGAVFLAVLVMVLQFDMKEDYNFYFDEYDYHETAVEMLDYIDGLDPAGRIAVEIRPDNQSKLGTPHFFANFLPLKYDIPVVPGLLTESSLSSAFIMPSLVRATDSIGWGNVLLLKDKTFTKQDRSSMLERLSLYNVEYILLTSDNAEILLNQLGNKVSLQKRIGDFDLLKLADSRPFIESVSYHPFLFIDEGGMDFRTFSEEWFKLPELFKYPVIYTEKDVDDLSDYDLSQIGGFITSSPDGLSVSIEDLESVFSDGVESVSRSGIFTKVREDEHVEFFSESGTLINYSYFPRWKSVDPEQTVFWTTPSIMFVFGRGETELFYD